MVDKFICPKCHFENEANASECKNCGNDLSHLVSHNEPDPEWLSFLRDAENEEKSESENQESDSLNLPADFSEGSSNEELNWLERIKTNKKDDQTELEADSESKQGDHLKQFDNVKNDQENPKNNDWLVDFRKDSENSNGIDQTDELENNLNLDWLEDSSGEGKSEETFSLEDLTKDWQKEFSEQIGIEDVEGISPAEELPQWLNKDDNSPEIGESIEKQDIPNWLNSSYNQVSNDDLLDEEPSNLPDWLSKSDFSNKPREEIQPDLEDKDAKEQGIPDWISEINKKIGGGDPLDDIEKDKSESPKGDQFDSRLLFNKLDLSPQVLDDEPEISDQPTEQKSESSDEDSTRGKGPAFILKPEEADHLPVKPFIDFDETENWDEEISRISAIKADEKFDHKEEEDQQRATSPSSSPPFTFGDIPSWMDDIDFDTQLYEDLEQKTEEPESSTPIPENLEKANLPEWLKAIRPVEVVTPKFQKNTKKQVEKSGPLAGLQGVLSSEGVTKSYTKPPTYSVSLNVTEKQKNHLQILEDIINPSVVSTTNQKKKKSKLQSVENILIPLFLSIIIFVSIFTDHSNTKLPQTFPADAVRFYNLATGYLSRNASPSHVLAIFETDASSYPEMNLISKGFFESLFKENHWITTVATNPNGVILAEEILSNAHRDIPSYNIEERVNNLGYLPGNIVGIQSFISNPRILSTGLDVKSDVWEAQPLSNINSFTDFDMIVILTDNSDQAKLWIEQMNLTVPESSLLFITTAKASPLLQPYLETSQIDGILSGILGGLSYDLLSSSDTNEIIRIWSINQLAIAIFILLILAGGVISLFSNAFSSNPDEDKNK